MSYNKILGLDLSFRHTGCAVVERIRHSDGRVEIKLRMHEEFSTDPRRTEQEGYLLLHKKIFAAIAIHDPIYIIMEAPDRSQSAASARMMGMVRALAYEVLWHYSQIATVKIVNMHHLKKWSGSKRGDKKDAVQRKVAQTFEFLSDYKNDNIVDAVGLCLTRCDELSQLESELL